ncbi:MAG: hypothetical protein NTZ90_18625 [Proteobacteria bacterium]|nr:hypothetical protein [Pseudomonadota bacterium]
MTAVDHKPWLRLLVLSSIIAAPLVAGQACSSSSFNGSPSSKSGKNAAGSTTNNQGGTDATNSSASGGASTDPLDQGRINPGYNDDKNGPLTPGNGGTKAAPSGPTDSSGNTPIRIYNNGFNGIYVVKPLTPEQNNYIWAATADGAVTLLQLANNAVVSTKKWTGALGGAGGAPGSRTYVLEGGGVIVSRIGGYIYFIDPNSTPQGDIKSAGGASFYKLPGPAETYDRVCAVSYRRGGNRYLGLAWGFGHFVEVPQDNTPPFAPIWSKANLTAANAGPKQWGYSCFIDQNRLIFYSQWTTMGQGTDQATGPIQAVDLNTMKAVTPAAVAGNGTFTSSNLANETVGPKASFGLGSYAMSGDANGNILNGTGYYTFAYEPQSNTIWGCGSAGGASLNVFPAACFSSLKTCTGHSSFNSQTVGFQIGPMSALGDGHMVGLVRHSGEVIMLSLNDRKDISKGVTATKIYKLDSDPYMYTDFTGATLYLTKTEQTFSLGAIQGYDATKPFKTAGFTWAPRDIAKTAWSDITFEVRCYMANAAKPSYVAFADVGAALQPTTLSSVAMCSGQTYDSVDIRLTQINNGSSLMNVRKVQVTGFQ